MAKTPFCIDSCSLMTAMRVTYPIKTFPGLWSKLAEAFDKQQIISTQIVYEEIEIGDDELVTWIKPLKSHFLRVDDDLLHEMALIVTKYPTLIDHTSPREQADPYLIGLAKLKKGIVVTEETLVPSNARRTRIPNVCRDEDLESIKLIEMIGRFSWSF